MPTHWTSVLIEKSIQPFCLLTSAVTPRQYPSVEKFEISIRETLEADWPFEEAPSIGMKNLVSRED